MNAERFRRLQEIFHQAIERDPDRRTAFIDAAAAGDGELRGELLSLVASYHENDTFLESTVLGPALGGAAATLTPGQSIGPYRIEGEIGRGGMGVVYLAEDTRLDRKVALKSIAPDRLSDPKLLERFRREARAAASLSHPAIATVYALEEVQGDYYLVSEYVPGDTLRAEMRPAGMSAKAVLDAAVQVADGLAAAHERGVVHRDLKPENIIRGSDGRLKIADFGSALIQRPGDGEQRLTQASFMVGTPAYMSPEQLQGNRLDFRSDMFSFGILLLELATGAHPFEGENALQTAARILEKRPAGLDDLSRDAPGLARIIERCLRKRPGERHNSTAELATDLREAQRGGAGPADATDPVRPDAPSESGATPSPLASRWWTFHQGAVIVFYAVIAFVLAWNAGTEEPLPVTLASVYVVALCAIANGVLRSHLLFTARFNTRGIRSELERTRVWTRLVDGLLSVALLVAAATLIGESRLMAGILASVAVGHAAVFLVAEPSTVRAVFPARDRFPG